MAEFNLPQNIENVWASSGDVLKPSDGKIVQGWTAEIPPRQWFNWLDNRQDQAIAHIIQHGISVWSSTVEYQAGKSYVQGSNGIIYRAKVTNTGSDPVQDTQSVNWVKYTPNGGLLNIRIFQANSTYTPTQGTNSILVHVQAGGGSGGNSPSTDGSTFGMGSGGGAGGFASSYLSSGFSSVSVVVGQGAQNISSTGGSSSFGSFLSATGGSPGTSGSALSVGHILTGGAGGQGVGGNLTNAKGGNGSPAIGFNSGNFSGGAGGNSMSGGGGSPTVSQTTPGSLATSPGAGGGGAASQSSSASQLGGAGANGYVIVWEYA